MSRSKKSPSTIQPGHMLNKPMEITFSTFVVTPFTKSEFLLTSKDSPHSVSLIMLPFAIFSGFLVVGAVLIFKGASVLKFPPGHEKYT